MIVLVTEGSSDSCFILGLLGESCSKDNPVVIPKGKRGNTEDLKLYYAGGVDNITNILRNQEEDILEAQRICILIDNDVSTSEENKIRNSCDNRCEIIRLEHENMDELIYQVVKRIIENMTECKDYLLNIDGINDSKAKVYYAVFIYRLCKHHRDTNFWYYLSYFFNTVAKENKDLVRRADVGLSRFLECATIKENELHEDKKEYRGISRWDLIISLLQPEKSSEKLDKDL